MVFYSFTFATSEKFLRITINLDRTELWFRDEKYHNIENQAHLQF
jgi:hypothetical protein